VGLLALSLPLSAVRMPTVFGTRSRDHARTAESQAAVHSPAHVSAAMARSSQAPVLILTAPYASTIRIAMVVATAAA
jgi:hypothetical protein